MLPRLMARTSAKDGGAERIMIVTATSGDTGKAALAGFADAPGTGITVFYPEGKVSRVQNLQMSTQEGGNVAVCGIRGNFDDAQSAVKRIFADKELAERLEAAGTVLSSANSINVGRLVAAGRLLLCRLCAAAARRRHRGRRCRGVLRTDRQLWRYPGRLLRQAHGSARRQTRRGQRQEQRAR